MNFMAKVLFFATMFSVAAQAAPVTAVSEIDLAQYAGTWYEIASIPPIFQAGCRCTTANYELLETGNVSVNNSCRIASFPISIKGEARVANPEEPAKLKVRFFGAAEADYWVLSLAPDYSYALVGTPNRKAVWILSRTRTLEKSVFDELYAMAADQGFALGELKMTRQENCAQ
jgi:apolipoprotein D and lipocalin family protein